MNILKISAVVFITWSGQFALAADKLQQADVVVYGDAAGGVTAAVQACRMGKKTILVSQYGHLGGMSSSGLGFSDIGNPAILGGLSREFYHRVYQHYQNDAAWDQEPRSGFKHGGQGTAALDSKTELASVFEPKVAEAVFDAMVKEAGVEVIKGRMDLARGVEKSGARISAIRIEGGVIVKGKMFIDASYEGEPARSMGALRHPHRLRIDPHGAGVHGIGAKRGHGGLSGD